MKKNNYSAPDVEIFEAALAVAVMSYVKGLPGEAGAEFDPEAGTVIIGGDY